MRRERGGGGGRGDSLLVKFHMGTLSTEVHPLQLPF